MVLGHPSPSDIMLDSSSFSFLLHIFYWLNSKLVFVLFVFGIPSLPSAWWLPQFVCNLHRSVYWLTYNMQKLFSYFSKFWAWILRLNKICLLESLLGHNITLLVEIYNKIYFFNILHHLRGTSIFFFWGVGGLLRLASRETFTPLCTFCALLETLKITMH